MNNTRDQLRNQSSAVPESGITTPAATDEFKLADSENSSDRKPELTPQEKKDVSEHKRITAAVIHEAIREQGEAELERRTMALVWSALAAGLSMGFSLMAEGLLESHLPDASWRPLVAKLGYSIGFLIVVMGRQQLFTENTLTVILPLLHRLNWSTLRSVLRLWGIVLTLNLIGAFLFAWTVSHTNVFEPEVKAAFSAIAHTALAGDWLTHVLRGIFAGWLIATMVWVLPAVEGSAVFVIILMTYLVSLGGFPHVIAGSIDVMYLVTSGQISWGTYFLDYLLPTLTGNTLGGVALVAALNHVQVVPDTKT